MQEESRFEFSDEEITRQALVHSSALTYLMVAYAQDRGATPEHVAEFAGRIFAKGWARLEGAGAFDLIRHIALIATCIGAENVRASGDFDSAELYADGALTHEDARFFGIERDDADRFCNVFAPMVASLGFDFTWRREGETLVYSVRSRKANQ